MKKVLFSLILFCVGAFSFGQNGVISELSGTVELRRPGASAFIQANVGDLVGEDTVISTGLNSSAVVEVGSSLITVRPLTRLSLTEISSGAGTETVNMNLRAGRVRVDLNPPAGTRASLAVVGPQSTASVRGTSFEFDTMNVIVDYGAVNFRGNRSRSLEYVVFSGGASSVGNSGIALDPINVARKDHSVAQSGSSNSSDGSSGNLGASIVPGGIGGGGPRGGVDPAPDPTPTPTPPGPSPTPTPPNPRPPNRPDPDDGGGSGNGSGTGDGDVGVDWIPVQSWRSFQVRRR